MCSLQILHTTCIARNLVMLNSILCPRHTDSRGKSIEGRQLRVFPSFEAFIAIVGVHCEISDTVVCWLPATKSSIVKGLTYGPWSSNGANETRAPSTRRKHQRYSQSNDLLWGHISVKLRSKRTPTSVYGVTRIDTSVILHGFRDKRSLYIEKMHPLRLSTQQDTRSTSHLGTHNSHYLAAILVSSEVSSVLLIWQISVNTSSNN